MKRLFTVLASFFILLSLLLCGCTDAEFLTEETFLSRFNAIDESQQLTADDAMAKEEDAFIGRTYFLSPKGGETYLLCLQIDKESAELKGCSLLYATLEDEESDTNFASLASRTAQAFTGQSAQACDAALKKAGVLGASGEELPQAVEWNGYRISKEAISLGYRMTIETIREEKAAESESSASPETTASADSATAEKPATEEPIEPGTASPSAA